MDAPANPPAELPVADLLRQVRAGSADALNQLLCSAEAIARGRLRHLARRRLAAKVGDSDLVQDTLLEVGCHLLQFHGDSWAQWEAWIRRIVLNRWRDVRRHYLVRARRSAAREVPLEDAGPTELPDRGDGPLERLLTAEERAALQAELDALTAAERQVVLGRLDGWTYEQIGGPLGLSAEAVRKFYARVVGRLALRLARLRRGAPRAGEERVPAPV